MRRQVGSAPTYRGERSNAAGGAPPCWEYLYAQSTSVAAGLGAHLLVLQLEHNAPARAAAAASPGFGVTTALPPPAAAPHVFNSRSATFGPRLGGQCGLK